MSCLQGRSQFLALVLLLACGCGGENQLAQVSGQVKKGDEPQSDVIVRFRPVASEQPVVPTGEREKKTPFKGMESFGKTDSNGRFTLRLTDNSHSGAYIGDHAVMMFDGKAEIIDSEKEVKPTADEMRQRMKSRDSKPKEPESRIPKKWQQGSERFTVKAGSNRADFDLSK